MARYEIKLNSDEDSLVANATEVTVEFAPDNEGNEQPVYVRFCDGDDDAPTAVVPWDVFRYAIRK
jgi:hypothetical protein